MSTQFLLGSCCHGDATIGCGNLGLVEEHQYLVYLTFIVGTVGHLVGGIIVAADDLIAAGIAASLVVADAEAHHVDSHVGGTLVGTASIDTFKQSIEHWEYLDVTVVVDGNLVIRLQVERVNHVDVIQVGGGSLIGNVDGVLQRQVPYGEGLELGISGMYSPLVLIVELRQADSHLAAAWTGSRDDDQLS